MTRRGLFKAVAACAAFGVTPVSARSSVGVRARRRDPALVRAVSFNIRYGTAADGPDAWGQRSHRVDAAIALLRPQILATQEAHAFQIRELLERHPRFAAVGAHRVDGRIGGEGCVTLYDRESFLLGESGVFGLSDEPERIGHVSWDNAWPRICAWARLIEYRTGASLLVANTHLDNRGKRSQRLGARLIRDRLSGLRRVDDAGVVLMGDFNAVTGEPALEIVTEGSDGLRDTIGPSHRDAGTGTYTAFDPTSDGGGRRIDFVLASARLAVEASGIERSRIDGRYPSDHFPVWADLRLETPREPDRERYQTD
ncbi:MAG: endonuclease/exonuclease/phosphatase family protein [Planctomycetota bacterium]